MATVDEVILTLPYFGSIDHYACLIQKDAWIDIHEHYEKQSCRNRMYLCGSQGKFSLTAPVHNISGQKELLKDVRLSYQKDWPKEHWKSIRSAYGASPFLLYYEDALKSFFQEEFKTLVDLNLAAHELICKFLKTALPLRVSDGYVESTYGQDRRPLYKNHFAESTSYIQVFADRQDFIQGLSILDLILCVGPEALSYLNSQQIQS